MIILILAVLIVIAAISGYISYKNDLDSFISFITCVFSVIGIIIVSVWLFIEVIVIAEGRYINEKISVYQNENTIIENDIKNIVERYMDFEHDTYKEFANLESLITLYPDLKSNELVNKQIEIYISNKKEIKELKEEQINIKSHKWLVYFG